MAKSWVTQTSLRHLTMFNMAVVEDWTDVIKSTATCDSIFHRVRPSPPTMTPMVITRVWNNASNFTRGTQGKGWYYAGHWSNAYSNARWTDVERRSDTDPTTIAQRVAKARAKMTGDIMDLGETFGGLRDTVRMIAKRLKQLDDVVRALSKNQDPSLYNPKLPKFEPDPSKDLASLFLEYQFGWKQLAQDIYDALEIRHKLLVKGKAVRHSSGGKGYRLSLSSGGGPDAGWGGPLATRAVARGVVSNPALANLNALGLANPLSTGWQITRASFLVDWVYDVGSILASWTWGLGLSNTETCYIVERRNTRTANFPSAISGVILQASQTVHRKVYDPAPMNLSSLAKQQQVIWSSEKIMTASAMLRQLLH